MYKLEKIEIEEGKSSALETGYVSNLPYMFLADFEKSSDEQEITSIKDLEVGKQLILRSWNNFHRTSKISQIEFLTENLGEFKTQTSWYRITRNV